jgi:hypothetical protein
MGTTEFLLKLREMVIPNLGHDVMVNVLGQRDKAEAADYLYEEILTFNSKSRG